MPKPTPADRAVFEALVPERPDVAVKPMFGQLGAFVNGNLFMGLFGSSIGLRLPPQDRAELLQMPGAGPFGPPERPMRDYVALPPYWREPTEPVLDWVERALAHVAAMPAKAPRRK